uniref:Pancreatic trypsin inhibitor n=1 Tax=Rhipicephalus zambeziensis TaxID=60191 RepID=A0A224YBC0_9ACAR
MKIALCTLLTYYVFHSTPSHARVPPRCRRMPRDEDECEVKVSIHQWYYNTEEQRCKKFMFGDCPDNSNKFETEMDCKAACLKPAPMPTKPPKVQKEPPKRQPPSIPTPPNRYGEPPRRRPPKPSRPPNIYGGGGHGGQQKRPPRGGSPPSRGGQKGFRRNMCSVTPIEGDCEGSMLWYFDLSKVRCRRLKSGLCKGTHEFFTSKKECDNRCKGRPGSQRRRCFMLPDEGDCEDVEKWYYSPKRDKCRIFREGDCEGDQKFFDTKEDCLKTCNGILSRPGGAGQVNGTGGGSDGEAGRNKTEVDGTPPPPSVPGGKEKKGDEGEGESGAIKNQGTTTTKSPRRPVPPRVKRPPPGGGGMTDARRRAEEARRQREERRRQLEEKRRQQSRPPASRPKPNCGVRARKRKVCEDFTDKWWFDGYFRICNIVKEGECPSHGSFFDSCEDCMSRCNRRDARRCVYIEEKIRKQRGR